MSSTVVLASPSATETFAMPLNLAKRLTSFVIRLIALALAVLLFIVALQVIETFEPSLWQRAQEYVHGPPPSFEECQQGADVWRQYGRTTLTDWQAKSCYESYHSMVR